MMYDMQRRNVLVLLAKNEEECVKELCEFWYVVPPTDIDHLQREERVIIKNVYAYLVKTYAYGQRIIAIVDGLAFKAIVTPPATH